jgi:hypothetical protein
LLTVPYRGVCDVDLLVGDPIENQSCEITWRRDAQLAWINAGDYSFRNPKTIMTDFSARRFKWVAQFLAALGD